MVDAARITSSDVFVDIGSGIGRASAFVHMLTGARVIGIEVQPALVRTARELTERLALSSVSYVEGDVATMPAVLAQGSVFFLYCPFSGERLTKVLGGLEAVARSRPIRICCLDLPLPACRWLTLDVPFARDLAVYGSVGASASMTSALNLSRALGSIERRTR